MVIPKKNVGDLGDLGDLGAVEMMELRALAMLMVIFGKDQDRDCDWDLMISPPTGPTETPAGVPNEEFWEQNTERISTAQKEIWPAMEMDL